MQVSDLFRKKFTKNAEEFDSLVVSMFNAIENHEKQLTNEILDEVKRRVNSHEDKWTHANLMQISDVLEIINNMRMK